ncbi:MAG: transposase [Candidatus Omnitrophota bacterium]
MPRIARIVSPGHPHHITQRGNFKQITFVDNKDYLKYLYWLEKYGKEHGLLILAFCLIPNHVHLAAVPPENTSLAKTLKICHMRYSQYFNKKNNHTGHLWQGRFYSCVLDETHLYSVVRYIENNPVRAELVKKPEDWKWSSARAHLGKENSLIPLAEISDFIQVKDWSEYLNTENDLEMTEKIRRHTLTGRPLGNGSFIQGLEDSFGKRLRALPKGRPVCK